jgi:4a-hydroxytetrahydrobiopterin dehydratase
MQKDEVIPGPEISSRLAEKLPRWTCENGYLCRSYRTSGWKGTLLVVNAIGHLAEAAWHHPDLEVSYNAVQVKLINHAAKGITDKDFELADKIEQVIMWQPGADHNSALDGTPEDPRFAYIKYD